MKRSWNKVLNYVCDLKERYKQETGKDVTGEFTSWLIDPTDKEITAPLKISQLGSRVLFKYKSFTEIYAGLSDPQEFWNAHGGLYRECRGVVIDVETEELILTPFSKFFNIDECEGWTREEIEQRIRKAKVVEFSDKLDGSMQSYRVLPSGEFISSGSTSFDPSTSIRVAKGREFFFSDPAYYRMCADYPWHTFIFEFICPEIDPHVVHYTSNGLWLTGIRDTRTGEHMSYQELITIADAYGVKHTEIYKLTLEDAYSALDKYKGYEKEGLVINIDGFQAKLKYNDFLSIRKVVKNLTSPGPILEAIALGTIDDLLSRIPKPYQEEARKIYCDILSKIGKLNKAITEKAESYRELPLQDAMKAICQDTRGSGLTGAIISYYKTGQHNILIRHGKVIKYSEFCKLVNAL